MLKQSIFMTFICIPNTKPSRQGDTKNNDQTFRKVIHTERQRILWHAMVDEPVPSTVPLRPNDPRFDLLSSRSIPQVYRDKLCGQSFDMPGVAARLVMKASETRGRHDAAGPDQAATMR
jgi:hypothetical protein